MCRTKDRQAQNSFSEMILYSVSEVGQFKVMWFMAGSKLHKTIILTFSSSGAFLVLRQISAIIFIASFIESFCRLFTKEKPNVVSTDW